MHHTSPESAVKSIEHICNRAACRQTVLFGVALADLQTSMCGPRADIGLETKTTLSLDLADFAEGGNDW